MNARVHPGARWLAWLARFISGANALWLDCRPEMKRRVYFANHSSHLDFAVLWACLPPDLRAWTRPVAAKDYWDRGGRRYLAARVFNAVLVERGSQAKGDSPPGLRRAQATVDRIVEAMGDRYSLIVFPEGTRGSGEEVAPFKSGIYHMCLRKPGLELVPVYLENLNRVLPKGETLLVPFLAKVKFGPPMQLRAGESKDDFLARARGELVRLRSA
jgi:1-acyl-sn-glycerol-3-phosphate acyltransferase